MTANIHPLAYVDPSAELADDVKVGPFCVIGPHVKIGEGCILDNNATITGHTTLGARNRLYPFVALGCEPQDLGYTGAATYLEIGDDNIFREGVTVHRGAEKEDFVTRIDHRNVFMANAHIGHNCHIFNNVMIVNGVLLGGHVHVHDFATISGNTVVHQFCSVGTMAFVSGSSRVTVDMPPYMLAAGSDRLDIHMVNIIGLQRRGVSPFALKQVRQAHRLLFRQYRPVEEVQRQFQQELGSEMPKELTTLFNFIYASHGGSNGRAREAIRRKAA